jgi:hypothetical protein
VLAVVEHHLEAEVLRGEGGRDVRVGVHGSGSVPDALEVALGVGVTVALVERVGVDAGVVVGRVDGDGDVAFVAPGALRQPFEHARRVVRVADAGGAVFGGLRHKVEHPTKTAC